MPDKLNLIDTYGREISYLRVSLTEQCNLRCDYCYDQIEKPPKDSTYLTNEQLMKLIGSFSLLGVEKIRFTGGEPLLRKGIVDLIAQSSALDNISQIGITTNGVLHEKLLPELLDAGLNRMNISLDTLQEDKFIKITGFDRHAEVLRGIDSALESNAFPAVKINIVVMNGVNDDEINDFLKWAHPRNLDIRFIEYMPTSGSKYGKERYISEADIKNKIDSNLEKIEDFDTCRGPAKSYHLAGSKAKVSFISPVSNCFCQKCNRLRLTSHGELFGCLFGTNSVNLQSIMLDKISNEELASYLKSIVKTPEFRRFSDKKSISDTKPFMRGLGG